MNVHSMHGSWFSCMRRESNGDATNYLKDMWQMVADDTSHHKSSLVVADKPYRFSSCLSHIKISVNSKRYPSLSRHQLHNQWHSNETPHRMDKATNSIWTLSRQAKWTDVVLRNPRKSSTELALGSLWVRRESKSSCISASRVGSDPKSSIRSEINQILQNIIELKNK